jgi:putative spermidine/putrescine transport system ATP-binding protein
VLAANETGTTLRASTGEMLRLSRQLSFVPGASIVLTVRPEDVTLTPEAGASSLGATLQMSIPHGPNVLHSLVLSDGTELKALQRRDAAISQAQGGGPLYLSLDAAKLHAFPASEDLSSPTLSPGASL